MSRRTAESNKAILAAWNKEQELVQEGKGTREWTPKQQQDIFEKGKAYDDDGVAFQGHHMKSAEMYPEYQGDPGYIQFLTRAEHLEAHNGNWRNPTNWYYNPVTKEKFVRKYSDVVQVWDTKDYELKGVDPSVRGLVSPLVMAAQLERVSAHFEHVRNHSLEIRRYYRTVEY